MTPYLDHVFGARGLLARRFPGYAPRAGQLLLTRAVDRALADDQHLLGEAPCGVGKSIAYSVPAIWHAVRGERRVVIATANIALQDQLVRKDLPLLADILPWRFRFAVLKGRQNYVCRARVAPHQPRWKEGAARRVRPAQLQRAPDRADRERAVRAQEGCVHGSR